MSAAIYCQTCGCNVEMRCCCARDCAEHPGGNDAARASVAKWEPIDPREIRRGDRIVVSSALAKQRQALRVDELGTLADGRTIVSGPLVLLSDPMVQRRTGRPVISLGKYHKVQRWTS